MNLSLSLLCSLILFFTIVSAMENTNDQIGPNSIQITGGYRVIKFSMDGTYIKSNELHNGRVYYQKENQSKSLYISWNQNRNEWEISHVLGQYPRCAYLEKDVLFPTLTKKHWIIIDKEKGFNTRFIKDKSMLVRKIDIENDDSKSFQCEYICYEENPFGVETQCGHKFCVSCIHKLCTTTQICICRAVLSKNLEDFSLCDVNLKNIENIKPEYLQNSFTYLPKLPYTTPDDILRFLERGVNVNNTLYPSNGYSALMFAVKSGKFDLVKCLVENGANINYVTRDGVKAFHLALSSYQTFSIFRYLMDPEENLDHDANRGTALYYAAKVGNLEVVNYLILQDMMSI